MHLWSLAWQPSGWPHLPCSPHLHTERSSGTEGLQDPGGWWERVPLPKGKELVLQDGKQEGFLAEEAFEV